MASGGDEESRGETPPNKKRVALRQISKDDDPDNEDDGAPADGGTFPRASDQVLAGRRMVKVRRTPAGAPSSAPNPFAGLQMVPPAIPVSSEIAAPAPSIPLNSDSGVAENVVEDGRTESSITLDQGEVLQANQATEAVAAGVEVLQTVNAGEEIVQLTVGSNPAPLDEAVIVVSEAVETKPDLEDQDKGTSSDPDTSALNGNEEVKARDTEAVEPSGNSSETFQQLSSATNAFAGSFGTGFSATPSVANNLSSQPSSGFAFGQAFAFGSQNFGSTPFGTGQPKFSFGASTGGTEGAFPSVSSVFGSNNGTNFAPHFGGIAPAAAVPKPAVVSLQEVQVETGEEKEKAAFSADAVLFEFLEGGWKERGKGELKLNVSEEKDKRPRLVMRSKGNYRLLLNANLFPDMKVSKMDNRGITFACANSAAEARTALTTYAVKLKDSVIAAEFTAAVEAHKGSASGEPKTPESSPKATERSPKVIEP